MSDKFKRLKLRSKQLDSNKSGRSDSSKLCSCSEEDLKNNPLPPRKVRIEYLYLDLTKCDRCIDTSRVLEEVIAVLSPALALAGYQVELRKIEMKTRQIAAQYAFLSSPTIRVNGRDICLFVQESDCGCCSEISGTQVDCRIFEFNGTRHVVPPKAMLAEAIFRTIFTDSSTESIHIIEEPPYQMPANLEKFFAGKDKKCSCGGNVC